MKCIERLKQYSDYRSFLKAYYDERKEDGPHQFSYSIWARQLELRSPSTLLMILDGKRNPSPVLIERLIERIPLKRDSDATYFRDLILLEKNHRNPKLQAKLLESVRANYQGTEVTVLDRQTFKAVSEWHYYAIRELVQLDDFVEDPQMIASRLKGKVSVKQIREAIRTLLRLELLTRDEAGKLKYSTGHIHTDSVKADVAIRQFHEQSMDLLKDSLWSVENGQREISGCTFPLEKSRLPEAKLLIQKFQSEFMQLMDRGRGDEVYHLEIGFIPLSDQKSKGKNQ